MKLIHCADIHLGSTLSSLPKELMEDRKSDVRGSFMRMVDYAKVNGIPAILISGDLFDRAKPPKKELDFFYNAVKSAENVDFLYLRGNHDLAREPDSYPNLKTFSETWRSYRYGDVTISGIELSSGNSDSCYSTLNLDKSQKNIVMLHGQIGGEINLTKLRDKNVDYLALGHVHSYSEGTIDRRGKYAYCGCLEGRGFDETGEKGFIVLDVDGNGIKHEFVPFSSTVIEEHHVDISGSLSPFEACSRIKDAVNLRENGIYRIILTGETDKWIEDLEKDVSTFLKPFCRHLSVKSETTLKINYDDYKNDLSLRGEFIRAVQATDKTDEEKSRIIAYGLKALAGEAID